MHYSSMYTSKPICVGVNNNIIVLADKYYIRIIILLFHHVMQILYNNVKKICNVVLELLYQLCCSSTYHLCVHSISSTVKGPPWWGLLAVDPMGVT